MVLILVTGFVLRFYQLGTIPNGLYQDETAIGYNAYSVLTTGKDEHGKQTPLYFKSFGDYKLPVYIYASIIPIKFLGLTPFAVRFPSAFFGFLTIPLLYVLVRRLTKETLLPLVSVALLAINPWHIHYSRATFEVSISLFLFLLGTYLLLRARDSKAGYFFCGILSFMLALYTYNLTRLLAPLLFTLVYVIFFRKGKKPHLWEMCASFLLIIMGLFPYIMTFFSEGGLSSSSGTLIFTSPAVQAPLQELRSYMVTLPPVVSKLLFNTPMLTLWQYGMNIASYVSAGFFFIHGSAHGNHGIGNVGQFYLFELPLIALGMILFWKEKSRSSKLLLGWAAITILTASLTRESPHATRSFFLLFPMTVFSARGMLEAFRLIFQVSAKRYRFGALVLLGLFMTYAVIYYFTSYFIRFPVAYAKSWRSEDRNVSEYIGKNRNNYDRIIIDTQSGFIYTSLLFYTAYPPQEFHNTVKRLPDDSEGFSAVTSLGNIEFKNVSADDFRLPHTLIITTLDRVPQFASVVETYSYPVRPVVIAVKGELARYPVRDSAYVIVSAQ